MSVSPRNSSYNREGEAHKRLHAVHMNEDTQLNSTFRRSQNGCWTCRLRRKKCDESSGSCLVCRDRGLHCAGYGKNKPQWMDGSVRQESIHKEIKATVATVTRMKRMMKSAESQPTGSASASRGSSKAPYAADIEPYLSQAASPRPRLKNVNTQMFGGTCDYLDSNRSLEQDALSPPSGDFYPLPTPENSLSASSDNCFPPSNYMNEPSSASILTRTTEPKSGQDGFDYLEATNPQAQALTAIEPTEDWMRPNPTMLDEPIVPQVDITSSLRKETRLMSPNSRKRTHSVANVGAEYSSYNQLDMHYDHEHYGMTPWAPSHVNKWPKLSNTNSTPRADILRRDHRLPQQQEVATISSLRTQPYEKLDERGSAFSQSPKLHDSAIVPVSSPSRNSRDPDSISNQLLQYEKLLLNSSGQTWQAHLRNVTSLLASRMASGNASFGNESNSFHTEDPQVQNAVRLIIWLDAVSRTFSDINDDSPARGSLSRLLFSTKPSPEFTLVPRENWIIMFLERINLLRQRTTHFDRRNKSIAQDLSRETTAIQTQLEYFLAGAADDDDLTPSQAPSGSASLCRNIFTHALLLYLHVVASGPFSEAPRIRRSVKVVMDSLNALDDAAKLSESLVWPFCVTGCLAGPEHHEALMGHYRAALEVSGGGGANPRLVSACMIMQECWRLRGRGVHAEWRIARESLEQRGQSVGVGCW